MHSREEMIHIITSKNNTIYDKDNNEFIFKIDNEDFKVNVDDFIRVLGKRSGESFECLYDEHPSCFCVLRCTECGTVVFEHYDEEYDPYFCCPVCTKHKTSYKYWTKDEVENDIEKRQIINMYIDMDKMQKESDKRWLRRGKKYDWQISSMKRYGKKYSLCVDLECDDITKNYLKGLRLDISIGKKDKDIDGFCINTKHLKIPLSFSSFYRQFIYKHLGKCHPDIRSKWFVGKPIENTWNK